MPVFGKSLFETVLDGMEVEEDEDIEDAPTRRPRIVAHFLTDTVVGEHGDDRPFGDRYEHFDPQSGAEPEEARPRARPAWLERLSEQDVSNDLGLSAGMTKNEIKARRRVFARANHPDGVSEEFREAATIRMTTANRLVEAALRDS